jgi:hypothetical protein
MVNEWLVIERVGYLGIEIVINRTIGSTLCSYFEFNCPAIWGFGKDAGGWSCRNTPISSDAYPTLCIEAMMGAEFRQRMGDVELVVKAKCSK